MGASKSTKNKPTVELRRRRDTEGKAETGQLLKKWFGTNYTAQVNKHTSKAHHEREFQVGKQILRTNKRSPWRRIPASPMGITCAPSPMSAMPLAQTKFSARSATLRSLGMQTERCSHPLHHSLPCNLVPWHLDLDVFSPLPSFSSFLFPPFPVLPPRPGVGEAGASSIGHSQAKKNCSKHMVATKKW